MNSRHSTSQGTQYCFVSLFIIFFSLNPFEFCFEIYSCDRSESVAATRVTGAYS